MIAPTPCSSIDGSRAAMSDLRGNLSLWQVPPKKSLVPLLCVTTVIAVAVALVQPSVPYAGRLNVVQFGPCFIPGVIAFFGYAEHLTEFLLGTDLDPYGVVCQLRRQRNPNRRAQTGAQE